MEKLDSVLTDMCTWGFQHLDYVEKVNGQPKESHEKRRRTVNAGSKTLNALAGHGSPMQAHASTPCCVKRIQVCYISQFELASFLLRFFQPILLGSASIVAPLYPEIRTTVIWRAIAKNILLVLEFMSYRYIFISIRHIYGGAHMYEIFVLGELMTGDKHGYMLQEILKMQAGLTVRSVPNVVSAALPNGG